MSGDLVIQMAQEALRMVLLISAPMLGLGLLLLAWELGSIQFYALMALPLLMLYSGKRGKWNMKYFFYVFYPAHLVLLEVLVMIT